MFFSTYLDLSVLFLFTALCFSKDKVPWRLQHGRTKQSQPHFRAVSLRDQSAFTRHPACNYNHPRDLNARDFPNLGTQFELEVRGEHRNTNITYRSTTTSDISNSRGAVTIDLDNRRETMLYDLKGGKMFRLTGRSCTEEALDRTSCNPLAYFVLNNTDLAAHCRFDATIPVSIDSGNESFRGNRVHKWKQCLRLQQDKEDYVFLMTYSFHEAAYTKYAPVRLDVDLLYPATKLPKHAANQGSVRFDFLSFVPRISNRSVFQIREPVDCPGWNAVDIAKRKLEHTYRTV